MCSNGDDMEMEKKNLHGQAWMRMNLCADVWGWVKFLSPCVLCRLQGCKNITPFPGQMSYKATKPGSDCPLS